MYDAWYKMVHRTAARALGDFIITHEMTTMHIELDLKC